MQGKKSHNESVFCESKALNSQYLGLKTVMQREQIVEISISRIPEYAVMHVWKVDYFKAKGILLATYKTFVHVITGLSIREVSEE